MHFHHTLESCDWKSRTILCLVSEPLSLQQSTTSVQSYPHSCITIDCSCIWQIKRGFHNGCNTLSLFLWLKIEREANVPDETHHCNVNVLSFFGLRVLCVALKSQDAVTQVKLCTEQCMRFVPHMIWPVFSGSGHYIHYWLWMSSNSWIELNTNMSKMLRFYITDNRTLQNSDPVIK